MLPRVMALPLLIALAVTTSVWAAKHPSLAKARALYNAADYDGAILRHRSRAPTARPRTRRRS